MLKAHQFLAPKQRLGLRRPLQLLRKPGPTRGHWFIQYFPQGNLCSFDPVTLLKSALK